MSLHALRRKKCVNTLDQYDEPDDRLRYQHDIHLLTAEFPRLHPKWRPTLFIDADKEGTEAVQGALGPAELVDDTGRTAHEVIRITLSQLQHNPIFNFAGAETLLRERGFVLDTEISGHGRGTPTISYIRMQQSVLRTNFFVFWTLLKEALKDTAFNRARAPNKRVVASWFVGGAAPKNDTENLFPLVERDGVLLPRVVEKKKRPTDPTYPKYPVHRTYSASKETLEVTPDDISNFFSKLAVGLQYGKSRIKTQVLFEFANSTEIFANASATALTLWQSQVLGYFRKLIRELEIQSGPKLENIRREEEQHARSILEDINRRIIAKTPYERLLRVQPTKLFDQNEIDRITDGKKNLDLRSGLTDTQLLVTQICGASHRQLAAGQLDEMIYAYALADWIGTLKRTGQAAFGPAHAWNVLALSDALGDRLPTEVGSLLAARLGDGVWQLIGEIANEFEVLGADATPYQLIYQWVRNPADLWRIKRQGRTITITGPLLDFPAHEVQFWNDQAENLRAGGRFGI
jgi:hypothetical protein